jgi:hypothetical protein
MRGGTVQINWHDLQPVLTLDFHPVSRRLATGGGDHDIKVRHPFSPFPICLSPCRLPRLSRFALPPGRFLSLCSFDGWMGSLCALPLRFHRPALQIWAIASDD